MLCYTFRMAMEPNHDQLLKETYQLARDNNRMLHAMRRNAFLGGILKLAIYAVLIGVPLYFFATYVMPILNTTVNTMNQMQGQLKSAQDAGAQVGAQFEGMNKMLEQIKNIPGMGNFGQ